MLFWAGSILAGVLGYKLPYWWVPAVLACTVAAAQYVLLQATLAGDGARFELMLFSLPLNLMMYYATFSIGRALGQRWGRRRKARR